VRDPTVFQMELMAFFGSFSVELVVDVVDWPLIWIEDLFEIFREREYVLAVFVSAEVYDPTSLDRAIDLRAVHAWFF
jgi:hypothetical protein